MSGGRGARLGCPHHAESAEEAAKGAEHDVRLHVHREREPVALTVLRKVADPIPHCVPRAPDAYLAAVHVDLARFEAICAEDRTGNLRPAGTHQAGDADDLAPPHAE